MSAYGVQKLMAQLGLVVTQRVAYKVTTKRKHSDAAVDNLLNQNVNPHAPNEVRAGDVTYLKNRGGLGVFSHRDGLILTPYCGLTHR
ncbi:Uncharacterised protein [Proteus mirabilis]|uniref:Transposase n=1 Tax=Proteus mirabilis TaxID=584 RepID=A0A2X2DYX9_PROMI|nr:Uncharacterised protein [Proteus mirabilis]